MTRRDDRDACPLATNEPVADADIPWWVLFATVLEQRLAPPFQRRALEVRALEWKALFGGA